MRQVVMAFSLMVVVVMMQGCATQAKPSTPGPSLERRCRTHLRRTRNSSRRWNGIWIARTGPVQH